MAESVVSFVVERLGNLLIEEAMFLQGVDGEAKKIYDDLKWMQGFLRDADARQIEDERVRLWVADIRNLAYDAADVLESFILRVASMRRGGGMKTILKRYVCILNECIVLHKVGSEIQDIKTRISQLNTRLNTYGLRSLSEGREGSSLANERRSELRRSYSHIGEEDFVGLEGDVENLVGHIVGGDQYRVVSICGMGGLGKTTIAKKIYNHVKVKRHFDAFAWICISQQWQTKDILQQLLTKLIPEQRETILKLRDEELMKKLFEVQQNKKCLVVLDDIWSTDAWECLRPAFPIENMGSKLLLTSRNKEVATQVDPKGFIYEPRLLTEDESWLLLQKKTLAKRDLIDPNDVKKIEKLGSEMVRHCGGLPLGVVVLGGILATKRSWREWETVNQSIKSYIRSGEGVRGHGGVLDILALSYNELPYQLKSCFLYLGKFSEDSEIETESLYQMWIAESMVLAEDRREGETMMDVADWYMGELAHRCMVQVQLEEEHSQLRRFNSCRLHDLMRDVCLIKAREEDFFKVVDFGHQNDDSFSSSSTASSNRRLVIYFHDNDIDLLDKATSQHLRSLFLFSARGVDYMGRHMPRMISHVNNFKLLRVLAIQGFNAHLENRNNLIKILYEYLVDQYRFSKAIGTLIHLRYLRLDNRFITFPSSITNLKHLETLDLREALWAFEGNANLLQKMRRLRHLYLPEDTLNGVINLSCKKCKRSKLRLGGLSNLETLESFDTYWCDSKDLFKLANLRKLTASVREDQLEEEVERIIDYLISNVNLRYSSLEIYYCDFGAEKGGNTILRQLLGCGSLHKLRINGRIPHKLPVYKQDHHFNFSPSLARLELYYSYLEEDPMSTLENLPNLRILELNDESYVGKEMVCSAMGFPQLKSLVLYDLPNLEKWRVDEGAMRNLSQLNIDCCRRLEMVPDGLRFITTLRELRIDDMPKKFKNRIRVANGEEGEDFDKVRHVPSILIGG